MTNSAPRGTAAKAILYAFLLILGIELGAGIFEHRVSVSAWASDPPRSVRTFQQEEVHATVRHNAGSAFWMFNTPLTGLLGLAMLLSSGAAPAESRRWRRIAGVIIVVVVGCTFVYFVPNLLLLVGPRAPALPDDVVTRKAQLWYAMNLVRIAACLVAFYAGLRSLESWRETRAT